MAPKALRQLARFIVVVFPHTTGPLPRRPALRLVHPPAGQPLRRPLLSCSQHLPAHASLPAALCPDAQRTCLEQAFHGQYQPHSS